MNPQGCSSLSLSDQDLIALISCTRRRLVLISPGVSSNVARVIVEKWIELGANAVQIVLDADPEVCRLGLGELDAIKILRATASRIGTDVHHQAGLRVGVVITDETTVIFAPTALLLETNVSESSRSNAIRIDYPLAPPECSPEEIGNSLGFVSKPLSENLVRTAEQDLVSNPPVKFDLARKVRVFNAMFEFVEFELRGHRISRKRVPIPSDLMGLANDRKTQRLLHSSFQLVDEDSGVSGERVDKLKQRIVARHLINFPGYGTVILRTNKERFKRAVRRLEQFVVCFRERLENQLQSAMDSNRDALIEGLLPSVLAKPPDRWLKFLGSSPQESGVRDLLSAELSGAFKTASEIVGQITLKVVFRGVTFESLNDADFMKVARKAIPNLEVLHEEYDAARQSDLFDSSN
jgi:hypothetical protein